MTRQSRKSGKNASAVIFLSGEDCGKQETQKNCFLLYPGLARRPGERAGCAGRRALKEQAKFSMDYKYQFNFQCIINYKLKFLFMFSKWKARRPPRAFSKRGPDTLDRRGSHRL
ncbi:MAG: hypothetical protein MR428_01195 [Mesosutterella sp.]|nr:hypothetical protein [Mesosutterella sp.]